MIYKCMSANDRFSIGTSRLSTSGSFINKIGVTIVSCSQVPATAFSRKGLNARVDSLYICDEHESDEDVVGCEDPDVCFEGEELCPRGSIKCETPQMCSWIEHDPR